MKPFTYSIRPSLLNASAVVLIMCLAAACHPFHSSMAEAEWNPETQRFEVALRFSGVELEQELSLLESRPVNLEATPDAEQILRRYVTSRMAISTGSHSACQMHWAGMEVEVKDVWTYFELQPVADKNQKHQPKVDLETLTVRNSLMMHSQPQQINLVTLLIDDKKHSMHFTVKQSEVSVNRSQFGNSPDEQHVLPERPTGKPAAPVD